MYFYFFLCIACIVIDEKAIPILYIIVGVIGGIVVLAFLMLIIWKIIITAYVRTFEFNLVFETQIEIIQRIPYQTKQCRTKVTKLFACDDQNIVRNCFVR